MATRFYFPSSGAGAAVNVTDFTGWIDSGVNRESPDLECDVKKTNSSIEQGTLLTWSNLLDKTCARQFVSKPIRGQTISGTVKLQIAGEAPHDAGDVNTSLLRILVVSNDGTTVRGTLLELGNHFANVEFSIDTLDVLDPRNITIADGAALSTVVTNDGDRIVVQIGFTDAGSGNDTKLKAKYQYGDDQSTDLPEDETTQGVSNNPWIEFSDNINFFHNVFQSAGKFSCFDGGSVTEGFRG